MNLATVRRACELRLAGLQLPVPFDASAFADALARTRGRPIHLLPVATTLGPCGLWAATDDADYIFFERYTTPLHRQHIIVHELSHLLCGHVALALDVAEAARVLAPSLRARMVRTVMGRHAYSDAEEQEAEVLASLILQRSALMDVNQAATEAEAALIDGLRTSLGAAHGSR